MKIEAIHNPTLFINAPEWFKESEFLSWLNDPNMHFMTWHTKGQPVDECSDVIVFVDPSLSGDGSDQGIMPDCYWNEIVEICRSNFSAYEGHSIVVRISNLDD